MEITMLAKLVFELKIQKTSLLYFFGDKSGILYFFRDSDGFFRDKVR
jgi:hypothetical protein